MAITDYYPGAALKLISSGAIVAAAKGFRVDLDIQLEPVEEFGDILVAEKGWRSPEYKEEQGAAYMKQQDLVIGVDLGLEVRDLRGDVNLLARVLL